MKTKSAYCGCLYFSANALARALDKIADEAFKPTGLAPSYGFLLMTVNAKPGILAGEIATSMELTPSTITRLIEKMEKSKYVVRETEGKYTRVYPTAKSKALDTRIKEAWRELYTRYAEVLGEQKSKSITTAVYEASMKLREFE